MFCWFWKKVAYFWDEDEIIEGQNIRMQTEKKNKKNMIEWQKGTNDRCVGLYYTTVIYLFILYAEKAV